MAAVVNLEYKSIKMSNALAEANTAVGLTDGYAAWKQDFGTYDASKKNF